MKYLNECIITAIIDEILAIKYIANPTAIIFLRLKKVSSKTFCTSSTVSKDKRKVAVFFNLFEFIDLF